MSVLVIWRAGALLKVNDRRSAVFACEIPMDRKCFEAKRCRAGVRRAPSQPETPGESAWPARALPWRDRSHSQPRARALQSESPRLPPMAGPCDPPARLQLPARHENAARDILKVVG